MAFDVDPAHLTSDTRRAVGRLFAEAEKEGFRLRIRSGKRSCREQNELYSIGREADDSRQVVTYARGCMSWHVLGRAVDIDILGGGSYARLGEIGKSLGFKWGGDFPGFPDVGHFEYHPGIAIEDVCPDPSRCSDVIDTGGAGGLLAQLGVMVLAGAVGYVGVQLARQYRLLA